MLHLFGDIVDFMGIWGRYRAHLPTYIKKMGGATGF